MRKKCDAYENCVFINSPFDKKHVEFLYAVIFTIICCRKVPKLTLLDKDSSVTRLDKIKNLISSSMFGIHDLSRCKSSKAREYFRMNMPFELGLDMGIKGFSEKHKNKNILIVIDKKFDYKQAISDLSGNDPLCYNGKAENLVKIIRDWLVKCSGKRNILTSREIWASYEDFLGWLKIEREDFKICLDNVEEYIDIVSEYLSKGQCLRTA